MFAMKAIKNTPLPNLADIMPYVAALACARVWSSLVFSDQSVNLAFIASPDLLFDLSYAVLGIAAAVLARKISPLQDRKGLKTALAVCLYASTLCWLAPANAVLQAIGAILGGAGLSLLFLMFAESLAPLGIAKIALSLAAARFAAVPAVFLADGLDETRAAFAALLLPAAAIASVHYAYRQTPETSRAKPPFPRFTLPWKPIALLALYAFVQGLRQHEFVGGAGVHSAFSTAFAMAIVLVAILWFSDKVSIATLYRTPAPLMVLGLLLVPVGEVVGTVLSGYLISVSTALVSFLVSLLLYDLCKRVGTPIIAPMGVIKTMPIVTVLGQETAKLISLLPISQQTQSVVLAGTVIVMVCLASAIVFSEKDLASTWGMRILDKGALSLEARQEEALSDRCDELTKQYRLTPREDEVLRLLAKGRTNAAIEKELFIASGTLKAHISHIYTKLDVHSKKDLAALFSDAVQERAQ